MFKEKKRNNTGMTEKNPPGVQEVISRMTTIPGKKKIPEPSEDIPHGTPILPRTNIKVSPKPGLLILPVWIY